MEHTKNNMMITFLSRFFFRTRATIHSLKLCLFSLKKCRKIVFLVSEVLAVHNCVRHLCFVGLQRHLALFDWCVCDKSVNGHWLGLADSITTVHRLAIDARVPVVLKEHADVSGR